MSAIGDTIEFFFLGNRQFFAWHTKAVLEFTILRNFDDEKKLLSGSKGFWYGSHCPIDRFHSTVPDQFAKSDGF